jgi:2-haloacid dehalogenase
LTERRYDAVVFDLQTALIDSWTLWNAVAGSPAAGLRWRRKYLELTYGQGAYRPYEDIVRAAAGRSGVGQPCADELVRRWNELPPWPRLSRFSARWPSAYSSASRPTARLN